MLQWYVQERELAFRFHLQSKANTRIYTVQVIQEFLLLVRSVVLVSSRYCFTATPQCQARMKRLDISGRTLLPMATRSCSTMPFSAVQHQDSGPS